MISQFFRNRLWMSATMLAFVMAMPAQAGFLGDSVSVSLTVHTTGAYDQLVWSNDPAVVSNSPVELVGDSTPFGGPLFIWTLDLQDMCLQLVAQNTDAYISASVDPITFVVSGLDQMPLTGAYVNNSLNQFGITNSQISVVGDTLTVIAPLGSLNLAPGGGSLTTEICFIVVPEASSLILSAVMATGLLGGYIARRRRTG